MGFASAIGTAAFVGRNASGDYLVQFNNQSNNTGYSSAWPAWAYEVAKSSVENGRTLWVGSNGDPFGSNLVFVVESRSHELLGERPAMCAHADIAGRGFRVVENAALTIDCRTPSISSSSRSRPPIPCASWR
jgi:hypothetical protein